MLDKLYTCKWKNGTLQTARVVERRLDKSGNWEYYMHYEDFDRRLDEWVGADRLGDEVTKHRSSQEVASVESSQKMTRTQKRRFDEIHTTMPVDVDPTTAALEHEREQATKVKNIQTVELGKYEIETWYFSPYPEEFSKCNKLFLCEFCLKYFRKSKTLERHKGKCEWRHPPGDEVYRHDNVSMFEVDGKKAKIYCQVESAQERQSERDGAHKTCTTCVSVCISIGVGFARALHRLVLALHRDSLSDHARDTLIFGQTRTFLRVRNVPRWVCVYVCVVLWGGGGGGGGVAEFVLAIEAVLGSQDLVL